MKHIVVVLLLASAICAETFEWTHKSPGQVSHYALYRAHPDSLTTFARIGTTSTRELVVTVPDSSILYVTAVDLRGRESKPSLPLDLTQIPEAPDSLNIKGRSIIIQINTEE